MPYEVETVGAHTLAEIKNGSFIFFPIMHRAIWPKSAMMKSSPHLTPKPARQRIGKKTIRAAFKRCKHSASDRNKGAYMKALGSMVAARFGGRGAGRIATPKPQAGEVLVKIRAATLGFPDFLMTHGGYQLKPPVPFSPGMEGPGNRRIGRRC